jgi:enolase-phosphatase E1
MIRAIVTDIEGTTSSLSFVKDVLFPYARERLPGFVREHGSKPPVRELLNQVCEVAGQSLHDEQAITQLCQWIDEDRKVTPLKALQGLIWEAGYREGDFTGHIYADAAEYLRRWHDAGLKLYVYSSGSVYAQKLLFGHSDAGDLTPLFSGYFDTQVGAKQDSDSYRKIVTALNLPAEEILFLSDIEAELDAAAAARMATTWLVRDGALDKNAAHFQVQNFEQIIA